MRDCRLSSLNTFFDACFRSTDSEIRMKVQSFYRKGGPSQWIARWGKEITNKKHLQATLESAMSLVLVHVQKEMVRASKCSNLQTPAERMSDESVDEFSLRNITGQFSEKAPTAYRLMRGILDGKNPFDTTMSEPALAVVASIALYWWNKRANIYTTNHLTRTLSAEIFELYFIVAFRHQIVSAQADFFELNVN